MKRLIDLNDTLRDSNMVDEMTIEAETLIQRAYESTR